MVRDCRINLIFEGSSEIMRLFIAREALDPHLKIGGPVLDRRLPKSVRVASALRAAGFYSRWYPAMLLPHPPLRANFDRRLRPHIRWCASASRKLARRLFHQMLRHGPALEKRQLLLARFVNIGAEIFAMSATLLRAQAMQDHADAGGAPAADLAAYFCRAARLRIAEQFRLAAKNADQSGYRLTQSMLDHLPACLSDGIVRLPAEQALPIDKMQKAGP